MVSGDILYGSLDNGVNWIDITSKVTGTGISWDGATLSGSSSIVFKITDAAGNTGSNTGRQTYVLDTVAPAQTVTFGDISADTGSSPSDFITKTAAQTVTASLSAGLVSGDILYGSLDNGVNWIDITSKVTGTGISWDGATLSGSSSIVFKITDAAGNTGSNTGSQAYVLDTAAPVAASLSLLAAAATSAEAQAGAVSVTGESGGAISVTFTNGSNTVTKNLIGTGSAQAVTLTSGDLTTLGDGIIGVSASQTDVAGNIQSATANTSSFTLDTVAPAAPSIAENGSSDLGDSRMNNAEAASTVFRVSLPVSGSLATSGDSLELLLGGSPFSTPKTVTLSGSDITNGSVDFTVLKADLGSDGAKALSAKITDAAGNSSVASTALSFTLDTAAPAAPSVTEALTNYLGDGKMNNAEAVSTKFRVTLPVSGSPAASGDSVELLLGGSAFSSPKTISLIAADITRGFVDFTVVKADLGSDGTKALSAKITDAAGNISTASTVLSFTLDTLAPSITSAATASAIDENSGTSQVVYTGTADETVTYSLKAATGDVSAFSINGSTGAVTLTANPNFEAESSYSFTLVATDTAGNNSEQAVTLAINDVNEAPTFTSMAAVVASGNEAAETVITLANLKAQGNEADPDAGGTVDAFVVKAISTGTLKIGADSGSATAWAAGSNDVVDATHIAYWTGASQANGTLNAFTVVAKDNAGLLSTSPVQVQVALAAAPLLLGTQALDGVANLDVSSALVLKFDASNLALGSGHIYIKDDMGTSGWSFTNATSSESKQDVTDNDVDITLSNGVVTALSIGGVAHTALGGVGLSAAQLANSVSVSGDKLIINIAPQDLSKWGTTSVAGTAQGGWHFGWDFGANYHVEFDAGIVTAGSSGAANRALSDSTTLNFTTVTPVQNSSGATSQKLSTSDGSLAASYTWHNGHVGDATGANAMSLNFTTGQHALFIEVGGGNTKQTTTTGLVNLSSFTTDDILYLDNMGSMAMQSTEGQAAATWSGSLSTTKRSLSNVDGGTSMDVVFTDYTGTTITTLNGGDKKLEDLLGANVSLFA